MAAHSLLFTPQAIRDLKKLLPSIQSAILKNLETLSGLSHPLSSPQVKKLKGRKDYYHLRVGDFRAVFRTTSEELKVLRIFDRKDLDKILARLW